MKPTLALLVVPVLAFAALATPSFAAPAAKAATTSRTPTDVGWPRTTTRNGVQLTVYQPQIDEWQDYRTLKSRAAFVLTPKGGKPVIGVMELAGQTTADVAARTVLIRDLQITAARFPSLPDSEVALTEKFLKDTFPGKSMTISLDRLAAGVERSQKAKTVEVKTDPPQIFHSTEPAILLMVQGKPVLAPIEGSALQFVVNTNWDLLFDPAGSAYYLLVDKTWLTAASPEGEWKLATKPPPGLAKLPQGDQFKAVRAVGSVKTTKGTVVPKVFYSDKPAELIAFTGAPAWTAVTGTQLLWAKNTERWVFQDTADKQTYFLVSGRWFRAASLEGPWSYAGGNLPEDFKQIPLTSPAADVLSSVPGTPEAGDAVLLAEVPNEAVINRKQAEAKAKVVYEGEPKFEAIEGTKLTYAVNTSSDVILFDGKYYLCQDAVWFSSATASGPWTICTSVPKELYDIPTSSPLHRVTYVQVVSADDPDTVVYSYTDGYYGAFIAGAATAAVLMWGSGWYYPPYYGWAGAVPIYRPWPCTYGFAAAYNPWTGGYAIGGRVYGPYASAGRAAWYNPATGRYGAAARVSGPYGSRTVAAGYNPRTGTSFATRQGSNGYAQWGSSAVRRGDDWVRAGHINTANGGAARWRGSDGGGAHWNTARGSGGMAMHNGDFYAGHDGNAYRRDQNGDWSKWDKGWNPVDHKDNLQKDRQRYQDKRNDRPARADRQTRPGSDRGSVRRERQPSTPAVDRANRDSFHRQRSNYHAQQQRSFQRHPGGFSGGSRSFHGGGGFHGRGGGGGFHGGGRRR